MPTRLLHLAPVVSVIGTVTRAKIGGGAMAWLFRFGYALLTLRILWG